MAKLTLLYLALAIVISVAQCAVLNSKDGAPKRIVRSPCYSCGYKLDFAPPPSPIEPHPPPVLRTENWSGLARSADGLQNAVYSGAAAAAKQGAQTSGEALALATSSVNGGDGTGLSRQLGYGGASGGIKGSLGVSHGISSGIEGSEQVANSGHGYGGSNFKEYHSYHHGSAKSYGNGELQQTNNNAAAFGSAAQLDGTGEIGHRGYGGGISAETNKKEQFEGYNSGAQQVQTNNNAAAFGSTPQSDVTGKRIHNVEYGGGISAESSKNEHFNGYKSGRQQVQTGGYGSGTGTQNGYLTQDGTISAGRVEHDNYNSGAAGGKNYGHHRGYYSSGPHREQQAYQSSSSSSQSGTFGRQVGGSAEGYERNYKSGRDSFGGQQSSQELHYGSTGLTSAGAQGGVDASKQLQGYGSSQGEKIEHTGQAQFSQGTGSGLQAGVSGSLNGEAQSALSGALNLASEGLHTGCPTCGKGGYALSNAKSHSGSAIALSIGG